MKLFHLSDLHLGKIVHKVSMLEDQEYILEQILELVRRERPDAVLLSGDLYDKPQISREAEKLYDRFLTELLACGPAVLVISGNHDSAAHVGYFSQLLAKNRLYTSAPVFTEAPKAIPLEDEHGPVRFWLLPFLKPVDVRAAYPADDFPDVETDSYHNAVKSVLANMEVDPAERNVLLAHQFVTAGGAPAERSDSEVLSIGGVDNVDVSLFDAFDYVALGHLHRPQKVGKETVRYSGTPLKYSFSEASDRKSITVVDLGEKGEVRLSFLPLTPKRDMRRISGTFAELSSLEYYEKQNREDYLEITLTDETDVPGAFSKLKTIYPNLLSLRYERTEREASAEQFSVRDLEQLDPFTIVSGFFEEQTDRQLSAEQETLLKDLMADIWGGAAE